MEEKVFRNASINVEDLPQYQSVELHKLDQKYLWVKSIFNLVSLLFLIGIVLFLYNVIENFSEIYLILILSFLVGFYFIRFILILYTYQNRGYAVREQDLLFKTGIITEETTIVPIHKIQHTVFSQNGLEKLLSLATLKFYTSGGDSEDLTFYGISVDEAQRIQQFVQNLLKEKNEIDG